MTLNISIPFVAGISTVKLYAYPRFQKTIHQLSCIAWSFPSTFAKLLHALVYGIGQVWSSYGFSLCWTCLILIESVNFMRFQREAATENGMRQSENQWGYGQLLSVLMLAQLVIAVINPFFGKI